MQIHDDTTLFSASDLVSFLQCPHQTVLDLRNLETPLPKTEDDEFSRLLQAKGFAHEARYLERLRRTGLAVADLRDIQGDIGAAAAATRQGLAEGQDLVFQSCLLSPPFVGHPDFLRRVPQRSGLGGFSYEVVDAKLARTPRAKFVVQLCLYSELLAQVQGVLPRRFHLALGDGSEQGFVLANHLRWFRKLRERFLAFVSAPPGDSYPEQCSHCAQCRWRELCAEQWRRDDHPNQVANITRHQVRRLAAAGVRTLAALARLDAGVRVQGIQDGTLERLRAQATLQLARRETGEDHFELIPGNGLAVRGLERLPAPDPGDLFFDMEGDALEEGGLEYLFGVYFVAQDRPRYRAFWAHDKRRERHAFEAFMDLVTERLAAYPEMHIYHYGNYEASALKRLMSWHGTREAEVDELLRGERLVDLYRVVREGVRVSEPLYSIKNLETFYMERRSGEVTDAAASQVYYERWRQSGEEALLEQIRAYNEDDCRSTSMLRDWLVQLRPTGMSWYVQPLKDAESESGRAIHETEARLARYRDLLLAGLPEDHGLWDGEAHLRELVFQLLDFHRRADKPVWWELFARSEMEEAELIEDPECIGALEAVVEEPPLQVKRSMIYTFRYPEQAHKRKPRDHCLRADFLEPAGRIEEIDERRCVVRLKLALRHGHLPGHFSLIPPGPLNNKVLRETLYRFADTLIAGSRTYPALEAFLRRIRPAIESLAPGLPIVPPGADTTAATVAAVSGLRESYLFIQGPPGAGKTYVGSHVVVELLRRGRRVGVSSNSHKAINNLLHAVERRAEEQGLRFRGVKKCTDPEDFFNGRQIEDETDRSAVIGSGADLLAGTAWLFAHPGMDQTLDYLVVDEAGQVSLANLVAMGTSARNLVLLGDQMQLQQPIRGTHPGQSGASALDYLLQGAATIAPDHGVFLGLTWRMHLDLCRFISDAVYDGRLEPESANQHQSLLLRSGSHPELRPTGIRFVPVEHLGCSQRSGEEAEVVLALYHSLLRQGWRDRDGNEWPISSDDVLVVAPYNMQVNLLKQRLPETARVGTVDKFQGQEAAVVIVSLATSSGDDLPRHMEFLYSKNRLNVAISRARCLALVVASPRLMAIRCKTVEQTALVNTLCWLEEYASQQDHL